MNFTSLSPQLVVKKSETPEGVLNGRAALCAGREDMSDEDDQQSEDNGHDKSGHRFSKPEHLKQMLESGSIPDAAMIHAARKRRQRAREQGKTEMNLNRSQYSQDSSNSNSRCRRLHTYRRAQGTAQA